MNKYELQSQLKKMTILYIEEDSAKRLHYINIIKKLSPKTYSCLNMDEAMTQYSKTIPDLVVSNIGLEGSKELELLKQLRKYDEDVFIIIMSEHEDAQYFQYAIELDVSSYLIEPVTQEQFEQACSRIMQKCCKDKDKKSIYLNDNLFYQANMKTLVHDGLKINLNKKEARLLEYFIQYKNNLITYAQIKKHIWPGLNVSSASLRTLVKNLRKKGMSDLIQNMSGSGYILSLNQA